MAQETDHVYHRKIDSLWNYCMSTSDNVPGKKFTKKIIRNQKTYVAKWEYRAFVFEGDSLLMLTIGFDVKPNRSQDECYLVRNNELVYAGVFHTVYGAYPNGLKREPAPVAASSLYFKGHYAGRAYPSYGDFPAIWNSADAVKEQFQQVYALLKTEMKKK
ncbi:hypothetical protein HHL16_13510 [Pseudoflavitalea sp. G-6-1-2]|uniref:hypothetical protein n=1 Tax=Pseudoflavitalea sp. G-6-1-2 TaxID=2728841 RepID=UPI00146AE586|nr:hypothetical protein [Pseudoflavitalea sp. G-6-1-2]NML21901.1 hypothetical protein [Pseudoflavitalea sp. G-6-1-2]